jgi:hypothetical protein
MAGHEVPNQALPPLSLENLWRDVVATCCGIINNEENFKIISGFRGHDQVIAILNLKQIVAKDEGTRGTQALEPVVSFEQNEGLCHGVVCLPGGIANGSAACFRAPVSWSNLVDRAAAREKELGTCPKIGTKVVVVAR